MTLSTTALRQALAAATPGPWTREKPGNGENGWPLGVAVAGTPGRQTIYASPPGGCFPSADCDLIVTLRNAAPSLLDELDQLRAEVARLREALRTVVDWEFPDSGKRWENGIAMSYGAAFGSNGERDYMRGVARQALAEPPRDASAGEGAR